MSAGSGLERPFELNAGVATLRFEADRQRFDGGSHLHGYKARLSQWRAFSAERLARTRWLDAALAHPAVDPVGVLAVGQSHAGHRDAGLTTGRDHRLLDGFAVRAPTPARDNHIHRVHHRT
jgi:hypothetical protein